MSVVKYLVIALMLLVSKPVVAADFWCPVVTNLPESLEMHSDADNRLKVAKIQRYLTNLSDIRNGYERARTRGQRNQIANCLMDHLVMLDDDRALLYPKTEADAATLELLREEVIGVIHVFGRDLRHKPELQYILRWTEVKLASR
ncbi:MAG: hypothetical protein DI585_05015 [Pseudomonas fluorescens]|nr:MAG: hypothetical protein DI585_05015 [Pseudomonas fluorescens]